MKSPCPTPVMVVWKSNERAAMQGRVQGSKWLKASRNREALVWFGAEKKD